MTVNMFPLYYIKVQKPDCGVIGLVISGGNDVPSGLPVIQRVCKDSIAGRTGLIQRGDEIVKVNGKIASGLGHGGISELFNCEGDTVELMLRRKMVGEMDNCWYAPCPLKKGFDEISIYDQRFNIENESFDTNNLTSVALNSNRMELQGPLNFTTFKCAQAHIRSTTSFKRVGDTIKITTETPSDVAEVKTQDIIDKNEEDQGKYGTHRRTNSASGSMRGRADSNSKIKTDAQDEYRQRGKSAPTSPASAPLGQKASPNGTRNSWFQLRIYPTASEQKSKFAQLRPLNAMMTMTANNKTEQTFKDDTVTMDLTKSPKRRFRDSFRIKKKIYVRSEENESSSKPNDNESETQRRSGKNEIIETRGSKKIIAATVHVPSIQGLGLHLGGGSTSIYGDSTLRIQNVARTGTACGLLRPGDEISEIDGTYADELTVFEAYKLLQSLVGRNVRIVVSRPARRTKSTKL